MIRHAERQKVLSMTILDLLLMVSFEHILLECELSRDLEVVVNVKKAQISSRIAADSTRIGDRNGREWDDYKHVAKIRK